MTLFIHFLHRLLSLLTGSIFTLKPPVPGAISYDFAWVSRLVHNPLNLSTIVLWPSEVLGSTNRYIFFAEGETSDSFQNWVCVILLFSSSMRRRSGKLSLLLLHFILKFAYYCDTNCSLEAVASTLPRPLSYSNNHKGFPKLSHTIFLFP